MKINPISNTNFSGIYKVERFFIKENTQDFIDKNTKPDNLNIAMKSLDHDWENLYIYTKDDWKIENELEDCLKKDRAEYWKAHSLMFLWKNSDIGRQIFETDAALHNGRVRYINNNR